MNLKNKKNDKILKKETKSSINSKILPNTKYYERFRGSEKDDQIVLKKMEEAYKRACQNRDFEIEKFWSRATYFWGFIVLIFTAYFTIIISKDAKSELGDLYRFIIISLNCSGILFTFAWRFVSIGSKHWQENWEAHIDHLEDFVTGPLQKTIFFRRNFYSVSRINQFLACIVIIVWVGLLIAFLVVNHHVPFDKNAGKNVDYFVLTPIITSIIMGVYMQQSTRKKYSDHFIRL